MRISSIIRSIEDTISNTATKSQTLQGIKADAINITQATSQAVCSTTLYAKSLEWKTRVAKRLEGIKE